MGGGRSSSASSTSSSDSRIAQESGTAISGLNATATYGSDVNITFEDLDSEVSRAAIDANAISFDRVLSTAERLFSSSNAAASQALSLSADANQSVRDSFKSAAELKAGTIDTRVIIVVVAAIGIAGAIYASRGK